MTTAVPLTEDGSLPEHMCLNGPRCIDKVDGHARETEQVDTFCGACFSRAGERVGQLPEQYLKLHAMIGDRHAGVDVNIKHAKPSSSVLLNLHVDTLMGSIATDITTAAEVVAEKMAMRDENDHPWDATRPTMGETVQACSRVLAPNLHILAGARGVGGRELSDPLIDVMFWNNSGTMRGVKATTGVQLVQRLDYLSSLSHFTLGMTRARSERDIPCTRCRAKKVGRWAGSEWWDCASCGTRFEEDDVRRQDKILLFMYQKGLLKVGEQA